MQKSAGQLNAICKLKSFLKKDQRIMIITNYNYGPLVRHFCSKKSMNKIEKIHCRALQFLHNDNDSHYNALLKKSDKCSMEVWRLRMMALEIF